MSGTAALFRQVSLAMQNETQERFSNHLGSFCWASSRFLILLVCTGLMTAIAYLGPQLVPLGFLLGGIPGLALYIAPSLFLYLLAWSSTLLCILWIGQRVGLPLHSTMFRYGAGAIAAAVVVVAAIWIPTEINARTIQVADSLRANDKDNVISIPPASVAAIVFPRTGSSVDRELACETLCQTLLYNGAVRSIAMAEALSNQSSRRYALSPRAFWLERRSDCPKPPLAYNNVVWQRSAPPPLGEFVEKRVRARIAAGDCLVYGLGKIEEAQITFDLRTIKRSAESATAPWNPLADTVSASRLEIIDSKGDILLRKTETKYEPLAVPLHIGLGTGLLTTSTYFGWARYKTTVAPIGPYGQAVFSVILGDSGRMPDAPTSVTRP